jgi:hypothetical protein
MADLHLNEQELEQVKELAKVFFTPKEIAIYLQADLNDFVDACSIEGHPIYMAFHSGRLQTTYELRKNIMQLANSGSSPAQSMALDLLKTSEMKMIDR